MITNHASSFQDTDNSIIFYNKELYRIFYNDIDFNKAIDSGLFNLLKQKKKLINFTDHKELKNVFELHFKKSIYKIIKPEPINYITYPYQWCFGQLKDAALLTLDICIEALKHNMILKDASAFNVQFIGNKPIFIDTGSFTIYAENSPWQAYGQFCRHFIAPLLLMKHVDLSLNKLFISNIDGIPLKLTSKLLPYKTKWNIFANTQIHWHARLEKKHAKKKLAVTQKVIINKEKLINLLTYLQNNIKNLNLNKDVDTQWASYYLDNNNYDQISESEKIDFVSIVCKSFTFNNTVDIGCNTGKYAEICAQFSKNVLAIDIDELAIEHLYNNKKTTSKNNILGIIENARNLNPNIGWMFEERKTIFEENKFDLCLALAITHHLYITNNINFEMQAMFFAKYFEHLIIEFIDVKDSQIEKITVSKALDIQYSEIEFSKAFDKYYTLINKQVLSNKNRILFYYQKNA